MDIHQILNKAETFHRNGELQAAEVHYRKALKHKPNHADALYGLGTIFLQQNEPERAMKYLQSALSLLPDIPEFLFNLAQVEEKLGKFEKAKKTYLEAAFHARSDTIFLLQICKKMINIGMASQALAYLNETGDETPRVSLWKARAHGALGEWYATLKELDRLIHQFPDNGGLWREHSIAAGHLRDYDTAIKSYIFYMAKKQVDAKDLLGLADLYLMARKPRDAKETIQKVFDRRLDNAEANLIAGKCARLEGDYKTARAHFKAAINHRPTFGDAWNVLSEITENSELAALANQCVKLEKDMHCSDKDQTMLAFAAGRAYEKIEHYSDAFKAFDRAKRIQKKIMIEHGAKYQHSEIEDEYNQIIGYYPVGGNFAISKNISLQRPIFIVGMPRSGTTLIEKILGCLEGVEIGGENEALEFVAQRYYREVAKGKRPMPTSLTADILEEMEAAYWHQTPHEGSIVTDKMPHNFRHVGLVKQIFPDAPVIYMKRDPRDVCLSIYSRPFPKAHSYSVDLDWLAHFYAQSERLKDHWKVVFPDLILEVKYEDLIENPIYKTQEIASFCGLDWNIDCLEFHKKQGTSFTFSELQVRKPINKEGIGRWQHYAKHLQPLMGSLNKYAIK